MNERIKVAVAAKIKQRSINRPECLRDCCVEWFRYQYPDVVLLALPAEGVTVWKPAGVSVWAPDLYIAAARNHYAGMFLSMETESRQQAEVRARLEEAGYRCVVCRSFDEFRDSVTAYMEGSVAEGPLYPENARDAIVETVFGRARDLYGYSAEDIRGVRRVKMMVYVRMSVAYILHREGLDLKVLSSVMNKDRCTLMYHIKRVGEAPKFNRELERVYQSLKQKKK